MPHEADDSPAKNTRSSKAAAEKQDTHNSAEDSSHGSHEEEQKQLPRNERLLAALKRKLDDDDNEEEEDEDGSDLDAELQQMKDGEAAAKKKKAKKTTTAKTKKATTKKTKEEKEKQKERIFAHIKKMEMGHVEVTADGKDIDSVGGVSWDKFSAEAQYELCKTIGVAVPNNKRTKKHFAELIINHKKGLMFQDQVKKPSKKKGRLVKPDCITKDGTLYKFVNVITSDEGRVHFINTVTGWDRDDADRSIPHLADWEALVKLQNCKEKNNDINMTV